MAALQFALLAACVALPTLASAHGCGLDAYSCHHDRKAGGYHCHRGPLAGQSFASKDEMLKAPARGEAGKTAAAAELVGKVVSVHDGDTLTVLISQEQFKVRMLDIDAPERKQPFGTRSRQSLADMCAGRDARISAQGKDRYGRTLGRVSCAGVDANAEQVRRGMAWVYERYAPKDSALYAVQTEAKLAKRGLWAEIQPIPPWEWRALNSNKRRGN